MKKRKRHTPTLFDRFCKTFGPAIMRICQFIDKQTHDFFEVLACILTGGAYQPQPYKETIKASEQNKKNAEHYLYKPEKSISETLAGDFRAIMGDIHQVEKDLSTSIKKMEHKNPEVAKAIQDARNSPEFQKQVQILHERMAEVQKRYNHIRQVCSHNTTIGSGNTSEQNTRK